jgi:ATP-binding cassette subfamily B protein/subfamily B ATP-binding cassette protein MsbA
VLVFLLGWLLGLAMQYASIRFGERLVYDLGGDLLGHLQKLSLRYHNRAGTGSSIRRVTSDANCVSTLMEEAVLPLATSLVSMIGMYVIMLALDARLALLSLFVLPLMWAALKRYSRPMQDRSYEQQVAEAGMYDTMEQALSGLPVVQAFSLEGVGDARFRADTDRTLSATIAMTWAQFRFKVLVGLATALGTAALVYVGAQDAMSGRITPGTIIVFLSYLASFYTPLSAVANTSPTAHQAAGRARRVLEVLDTTPDVRSLPGAPALSDVRGEVRYDAVSFAYERGRPVLEDVSFHIRAGEAVALVGPTGAGKSTLASLLPRFFDPDSGAVLIDGHDLRTLELGSVRASVSLVLQESFLFPVSIRENIAYGRAGSSREQIEQAARAANAHEFISRLPEDYDTVLGERGATLSGGERQRVAIARALLKDAPILILDEPTSALDAHTEHQLIGALENLMAGRTTLIIAHRLSTIRRADSILVLQDGRLVEQGSHADLCRGEGVYARLHALQFGQAGREGADAALPVGARA